eukprot:11485011-Alexandrium_andersonii.AAC.1
MHFAGMTHTHTHTPGINADPTQSGTEEEASEEAPEVPPGPDPKVGARGQAPAPSLPGGGSQVAKR